jgi:glyoxylase-like metal-dependent hydrolase (beta-lactamase superfamily II)
VTSDDTSRTPADLTIEVYTTPARTFVSATPPQAPDDEPTWSPMTATLIYGEHDAILVDALATYDQADALADWIEARERRLSRIYITHGHGDHWLGLARLTRRFPEATGLATAGVLARAEYETAGLGGYWDALFPGEVPAAAARVLPRLLTGSTLDLEGSELRVIPVGQGDTAESTILHVPSLAAVITGDLVFNQVYMMTAETGETEREQWIANLGEVAALQPAVVVAGHKKFENDNSPKIIGECQRYLRDFSRIAAEETTAAGIVGRVVERYPDWQNLRTLWFSASAAVKRTST